jgi:toxin YoeB
MKLKLKLTSRFQEDLKRLARERSELVKKVYSLLDKIVEAPFAGRGNPHAYTRIDKCWARYITRKHRLVYKVDDGIVEPISCYGHYDDH